MRKTMMSNNPLDRLCHHVTGAIERGEAVAIVGIPATPTLDTFTRAYHDACTESERVLDTYVALERKNERKPGSVSTETREAAHDAWMAQWRETMDAKWAMYHARDAERSAALARR